VYVAMPQSGSEPKFEPELLRTGPRFGPKFSKIAEPDPKSSPRFNKRLENANPFERVRTSMTIARKSYERVPVLGVPPGNTTEGERKVNVEHMVTIYKSLEKVMATWIVCIV
jgi:hypothetical protein